MSEATPTRTIADLARLAGVSKSTVSRALSDSPLISGETKERIRTLAREHDFHVNAPARRLSLKRSRTIGFVTSAWHKEYSVADLFDLEIMSGVSRGLSASHYDMLVVRVERRDRDWARQYLDAGRVDGFILLTSTRKRAHVEMLRELGAPFAVWGVPEGPAGCCSVTGDNVGGGRVATEHLLRSGRRRIAFVGGPAHELEVRHRFDGYAAALEAAGIAVEQELVAHGDYSDASGGAAAARLLERAPDLDALFVCSDLMAIAAIRTLQQLGRRVPDDVAVVGYDDLSIAQYASPPLTTVRQDIPEAGRLLAQCLVELLETGVTRNAILPVELVVRESA